MAKASRQPKFLVREQVVLEASLSGQSAWMMHLMTDSEAVTKSVTHQSLLFNRQANNFPVSKRKKRLPMQALELSLQ